MSHAPLPIQPPNAVSLIIRREVREMLGDWRIVVPMIILSLVLPLVLAAAALFAIRFINENDFAVLLLPFALLVTGFIPASFTIITALESFVGERERNTLESLLAMPLSDTHLYLSKFMAALAPPLIASFLSMVLFTAVLFGVSPLAFFQTFSPDRLLLMFAFIVVLAIGMVAGAVAISSHATTIRAANLMASLVLLPVIVLLNVVAFWMLDSRWDLIGITIVGLAVLGAVLVGVGVRLFSREEILAREARRPPRRRVARAAATAAAAPTAPPPVQQQPSARRAMLAIMRREVTETLTDWRVLMPVVMLSLVLPLVGVWLLPVVFQVEVVSAQVVGQLVPFGVLVIGFVPASFALITALESFVGERERNSLEPLLASPMSDTSLYVSKLLSALVTPLITSLVAMMLFTGGVALVYPELYGVAMQPGRVALLVSMIVLLAMLMVAAAVIISSHTGSIRAANLLASFVLVPVAILLQVQAILMIGNRWDLVQASTLMVLVAMLALLRTGLSIFNREEILSREHEQFNGQRIRELAVLFFKEYQPAGVMPARYQGVPFSLRRFYRHELPALLRELRPAFGIVGLAVLSGLLVGWYAAENLPLRAARAFILERVGNPEHGASLPLALGIAANNLRVSILSSLLSLISFGLFAFLVQAVVFAQIAFTVTTLVQNGGVWFSGERLDPFQFLITYLLPHAIIELPTFMVVSALGIRIGAAVLSPPGGFSVGHNILWALANFAKVWLLVLLPLIVLAGLVEGLLTTSLIVAVYGGL